MSTFKALALRDLCFCIGLKPQAYYDGTEDGSPCLSFVCDNPLRIAASMSRYVFDTDLTFLLDTLALGQIAELPGSQNVVVYFPTLAWDKGWDFDPVED